MVRWSSISNRAMILLVTALCSGAMTTLGAQQPSATAPSATPVSSPSTVLSGPRLKPEWPRFEPRVAESNATSSALLASGGSNHTFVFSTLTLVIIGVLVVLLVL
jgi:hypothetical protein